MSSWDQQYSGEDWVFGTEPNDFLREEAHRIPRGRVLCIGEGEGRNSVFLAEQGHEVVGVDQSRVGLEKAQALARERGVFVETVVSEIQDFHLGEKEWEGIVSIFFHLPPGLREQIHRSVVRGLAPGGVLILEAYTPRQLDLGRCGPSNPQKLMTLEMLREDLEGLDLIIGREVEREFREGTMHRGLGSVVQVVARRPLE